MINLFILFFSFSIYSQQDSFFNFKEIKPSTENLPTPNISQPNRTTVRELTKSPSKEKLKQISNHNLSVKINSIKKTKDLLEESQKLAYRPFAEYEKTGYLIINGEFSFDSKDAKIALAKSLPKDAVMIVLVNPENEKQKKEVMETFSPLIPEERLKLAYLTDSYKAFWARDAMPIPMFSLKDNGFVLIDAMYYYEFYQDQEIADMFGAKLESHDYYFEGGNFMANKKGDCFIVDKDPHSEIPDEIFTRYYGCKKLTRLPYKEGIGHIDEHARFVNDTTVLTDLKEYKEIFEKNGYKTLMLPKPDGPFETYVNSLIMDKKVVVPSYNKPTDEEAFSVYKSLGLIPEPAPSNTLSNRGQGSVHCITMTYPKVPLKELQKALKLNFIN
ncbi:MAG TPA: agmatine deiminase family protein [Elusimicrobiales bacterium]|jgi:agmatine/peptidylarginine deiminase|nr:agmatine deiminase family protein [Elusimicrobiales bacterium]HPO96124.1 agmatine deiminase family protein [Elusimicrobiales bacterium]